MQKTLNQANKIVISYFENSKIIKEIKKRAKSGDLTVADLGKFTSEVYLASRKSVDFIMQNNELKDGEMRTILASRLSNSMYLIRNFAKIVFNNDGNPIKYVGKTPTRDGQMWDVINGLMKSRNNSDGEKK
jgi:hypothetical protein